MSDQTRVVRRPEDMSSDGWLELVIQDDGDVIVVLRPGSDDGEPVQLQSVEFCQSGTRSPWTREALRAVFEAMERDNRGERWPADEKNWAGDFADHVNEGPLIEDRIVRWRGQSLEEEEEGHVELLVDAEEELRRLRGVVVKLQREVNALLDAHEMRMEQREDNLKRNLAAERSHVEQLKRDLGSAEAEMDARGEILNDIQKAAGCGSWRGAIGVIGELRADIKSANFECNRLRADVKEARDACAEREVDYIQVADELAKLRNAIEPLARDEVRADYLATFMGGHRTPKMIEAFQHGMETVFNGMRELARRALEPTAKSDEPAEKTEGSIDGADLQGNATSDIQSAGASTITCSSCGKPPGSAYYSDVPGHGDMCITCHAGLNPPTGTSTFDADARRAHELLTQTQEEIAGGHAGEAESHLVRIDEQHHHSRAHVHSLLSMACTADRIADALEVIAGIRPLNKAPTFHDLQGDTRDPAACPHTHPDGAAVRAAATTHNPPEGDGA